MAQQGGTAAEDAPISEIVRLMERHRINACLAIRENHVVEIVSRADLIQGLCRHCASLHRQSCAVDPHSMQDHRYLSRQG
jgi:hypothetical protein